MMTGIAGNSCKKNGTYIKLLISRNVVHLFYVTIRFDGHGCNQTLKRSQSVAMDGVGTQDETVSYWVSYDRVYLVLKYGKGYPMEETTLMEHDFLAGAKSEKDEREVRNDLYEIFNPVTGKVVLLEVFQTSATSGFVLRKDYHDVIDIHPTIHLDPYPLVSNYPSLVIDSNKMTLFQLDSRTYMPSSQIPLACQEIYSDIKKLKLEDRVDPIIEFPAAIRYSLITKGCMLFEKLKIKSDELGGFRETYLRVTLGKDRRTSRGIPAVLEIWPRGHVSPIHNHGGACGIIKVLHGAIRVDIYNQMSNPPTNKTILKGFDAKKGDVTWMGHSWYQTHQLRNVYDDWSIFDYVDREHKSDNISKDSSRVNSLFQFCPTSDLSFVEMQYKVLERDARGERNIGRCTSNFLYLLPQSQISIPC